MSRRDARLSGLSGELTPRERVLLLHRALLEDREPDPAIRGTMPREHEREFNRYVTLANGILHVITAQALVFSYDVEVLWWKLLLLGTQVQWGYDRSTLLLTSSLLATIPIPEDEYERERDEQRREPLAMRDVLEILEVRDTGVAPRSARQLEREVREAVRSGKLHARKRGRGFEVTTGALFDWMGE